jgi:hypothetical protein
VCCAVQDFKSKLVRLMLNTDCSEQCPVRKEIENMIEAQRWATTKMIANRPERMMRIALEVRSHKLMCGEHKPNPELARRVLVRSSIQPCLILFPSLLHLNFFHAAQACRMHTGWLWSTNHGVP